MYADWPCGCLCMHRNGGNSIEEQKSKGGVAEWRQTKMILSNLGIGKAQMNIAILIKILPFLGQYVTEVAKINHNVIVTKYTCECVQYRHWTDVESR